MRLTIKGRPSPKKNNKRIYCKGKRPIVLPSEAYERFREVAGWQLKTQYKDDPLEGDLSINLVFHIKGNYKVDGDNLQTSIFDILEDFHVIKNDEQIVEWGGKKLRKCNDWRTEINITPYHS